MAAIQKQPYTATYTAMEVDIQKAKAQQWKNADNLTSNYRRTELKKILQLAIIPIWYTYA